MQINMYMTRCSYPAADLFIGESTRYKFMHMLRDILVILEPYSPEGTQNNSQRYLCQELQDMEM